jgi:hypothetical protein
MLSSYLLDILYVYFSDTTLDVHKEQITIAVDEFRWLIMESIIETKAITILEFIQGLLSGNP